MESNNRQRSRTEPFFLLALFVTLGIALNWGVFPEMAQQVAVIIALCLIHVALIGRVRDFSRFIRAFGKGPGCSQDSLEHSLDDRLWFEIAASCTTAPDCEVGAETRKIGSERKSVAWSSGAWLSQETIS